MLTNSKYRTSRARHFALAGLGAIALVLAGCSGSSGSSHPVTPPDPVVPPGPGSGAAIPVTSAKTIVASITRVTAPDDGRPVVEIFLRDADFYSLTGLPAANISFVMARLEPGVNGASSTWHAITRRTEAFPGSPAPTPSDPAHLTGTGPKNQATVEAATAGTWTEKGKGVYTYKFAKSLKDDAGIPYDGSLPHRIGLEIRLAPAIPANNPVYTFTPATNAPVDSGREIVETATCNMCHDRLAVHGGARVDIPYCVMCHESYSYDAQSGNTIDFKVMIHKIHSGETLPSVVAGRLYGIYGYGNTFSDFSDVAFPQDIRNCRTCHREGSANTPQASNWRQTVNVAACTSCHDTTDFATGVNHGGVAATEDSCSACHGPNSEVANLRVERAHQIPAQVAAAKFRYEVLNVANTAPGQTPRVTIRVVDPTSGNAPYDIKAANGPFQNASASLTVDVAYSTRPDFTNTGSGSATAAAGTPAQPIRIDFKANGVADPAYPGGFTATATVAIPASAVGSGIAFLEGHPAVDTDGNGTLDTVPVPAAQKAFAITDATPVAYRPIVDIAKCDTCHQQLALHGNNRVDNVELCASCHNPNATDINRRVAGSNCEAVTGTLDDQSIDFKYMIHAIHAGSRGAYKVCGFNNTGIDFSDVVYPGKISNCEGCHLPGTYYPPAPSAAIATTFDAGPDRSTPAGDVATTAAAAACSACHNDAAAKQHMQLNTGSFDAVKDASSATPGVPAETCADCHGAGRPTDVKVQHGFGQSQ
jgi:OmcA/MtrC family decaheme c-type cytochrome